MKLPLFMARPNTAAVACISDIGVSELLLAFHYLHTGISKVLRALVLTFIPVQGVLLQGLIFLSVMINLFGSFVLRILFINIIILRARSKRWAHCYWIVFNPACCPG